MKRSFAAGLAILLPFALTLWILSLLLNLLTFPFVGLIEYLINADFETFSQTAHGLILFFSKVCILLLLVGFVLLVGYLGEHFLAQKFLQYGDLILHRIPFINKIYIASQEVVKSLFHEEHTDFSKVVLVPFPHEKTRSIGFITKRDQAAYMDEQHANKVSVFVPGTPNPTMGFMLLFDREKLVMTDLSVEAALKFVISCGVMAESLKK